MVLAGIRQCSEHALLAAPSLCVFLIPVGVYVTRRCSLGGSSGRSSFSQLRAAKTPNTHVARFHNLIKPNLMFIDLSVRDMKLNSLRSRPHVLCFTLDSY